MDTIEGNLDIRDYVETFNVNTDIFNGTEGNPEVSVTGIFSFAPTEDIIIMQNFFDFDSIQMLDDISIETMKAVSSMAQEEGVPLYDFLLELSGKVGGRMTEGFVGRVNVYIVMIVEEKRLNNKL